MGRMSRLYSTGGPFAPAAACGHSQQVPAKRSTNDRGRRAARREEVIGTAPGRGGSGTIKGTEGRQRIGKSPGSATHRSGVGGHFLSVYLPGEGRSSWRKKQGKPRACEGASPQIRYSYVVIAL